MIPYVMTKYEAAVFDWPWGPWELPLFVVEL